MLAKAELYVQLAQRIGVITKIIQALFLVAEGDICPQRGKHGDARFVADARTDECHLLPATIALSCSMGVIMEKPPDK